ncbi:MAG: hypothetical protein CMH56_04340 [Myxococcales bacterium]|nr:hypothetical protein [Myxococcales bacterium]|tara:strand:+ start:10 stop:1071 length:1062 start_codon:yes stop_codon:yes gene_type:complete
MSQFRINTGSLKQSLVQQAKQEAKQEAKKKENAQTSQAAENAAENAEVPGDADGPDAAILKKMRKQRRAKKASAEGASELDDSLKDGDLDSETLTANAVSRKGGGGSDLLGGDSFGEGNRREMIEQYLLGHIKEDSDHFSKLRAEGQNDFFDPELDAKAIEDLGLKAPGHMVRLFDYWRHQGLDRFETIEKSASLLNGFRNAGKVRQLFNELETSPIRDIYPLEVMISLLEQNNNKLPGVNFGNVLQNLDQLAKEQTAVTGHPTLLELPKDYRIKGFAILGGRRPGYAFTPSPKEGYYQLNVETEGQWDFALLAVPTKQVGRITRELPSESILEKFSLNVIEASEAPTLEEKA